MTNYGKKPVKQKMEKA